MKTGQAFPDERVSRLSERDVRASLSSEGDTHVHDVDYHGGLWRARAENNAGKDAKLHIDADSGRVVGTDGPVAVITPHPGRVSMDQVRGLCPPPTA